MFINLCISTENPEYVTLFMTMVSAAHGV